MDVNEGGHASRTERVVSTMVAGVTIRLVPA